MTDEPTQDDVLRAQQEAQFVGRAQRRREFLDSIRLPAGDPRHKSLFTIHGVAGIGKTYLTQQLRRDAEGCGAVCGYADESSYDVPQTISALARDLARAGHPLKRFDRRFAVYQDRRHQLEADPQAPPGAFEFVARMALKTGVQLAKNTPVLSLAADVVDPAATAEQAERLRAYLKRKLRKSDDVQLLLSPADILTPLLVEDLTELCRRRSVVLLLDTFEQTSPYLESWLADLFKGRYGAVPGNVTVVVSGQQPLDRNLWIAHRGMISDIALEEFGTEEARELLRKLGVQDGTVEETILELSSGLPLLLAMLGNEHPESADEVGDHTGDAVERFLRWVSDEDHKEAALAGALPRALNHDIYRALTGDAHRAADFNWLLGQPFVTKSAGAGTYHGVVRAQMLRFRRTESPVTWNEQHLRLADAFRDWRLDLSIESEDLGWADARWSSCLFEEMYHRLSAAPAKTLHLALLGYMQAAHRDVAITRRWARMIGDAGRDTDHAELRFWGQRLEEFLDCAPTEAVQLFDELLDRAPLDAEGKLSALCQFANHLRSVGENATAVTLFDRALRLRPGVRQALVGRGETHRVMGEFGRAIADFDQALEQETDAWTLGSRGQAHAAVGDRTAAMRDLTGAIALDPDLEWALLARARVNLAAEQPAAAFDDFARVLELSPNDAWTLIERAGARLAQGDRDGARQDLDLAAGSEPDNAWPFIERADLAVTDGRPADAFADYARAIEAEPDNDWAFTRRAELFEARGELQQALADLDRAVELDPASEMALAIRGTVRGRLQQFDGAKADLDRAIEIDPKYRWAIRRRGELHQAAGDYAAAEADFSRLIEDDPADYNAHVQRCQIRLSTGRFDEAAADIEAIRAEIEADDDEPGGYFYLGVVQLRRGFRTEGLAHLHRAVVIAEEDVAASGSGPEDHLSAALCHAAVQNWDASAEHLRLGLTPGTAGDLRFVQENLRILLAVPDADEQQLDRLIGLTTTIRP